MTDLGTFVKVWECDGMLCVEAGSEHAIDAAVSHYLDTGRDSLVHLCLLSGDAYTVQASRITSWRVCTPAGRRKDEAIRLAQETEDKELQAEFGWRDTA